MATATVHTLVLITLCMAVSHVSALKCGDSNCGVSRDSYCCFNNCCSIIYTAVGVCGTGLVVLLSFACYWNCCRVNPRSKGVEVTDDRSLPPYTSAPNE